MKWIYYGRSNLELTLKKVIYELGKAKFINNRKNEPYLIAAFGGSTTAGHTIDPNYTYTAQLERILRQAYPAHDIIVINCGVGGARCKLIYNVLLNKVASLKYIPKVAITHIGLNDAASYNVKYGRLLYSDYYYVNPNFFLRLNRTLETYSLAYLKLKEKYEKYLAKNMLSGEDGSDRLPKIFMEDAGNLDSMVKNNFQKYLKNIIGLCRKFDIEVILSTESVSDRMRKNTKYMYFYSNILKAIRATANEEGVDILDFERSFNDMQDRESLFMDDIHLNEEGNRRLAEGYASHI